MADNSATPEEIDQVIQSIPQKPPFLFVDKILELSDSGIVTQYRLKEDEYFYRGHFPGKPITPGVILIEMMAQSAVVALGIYLLMLEKRQLEHLTFFTECEMEFSSIVLPGTQLTIRGEKIFHRRNKLKSKAQVELSDGTIAARGILAGMEVEY